MHQLIRKEVQQLDVEVLKYPNQYTSRVHGLLDELLKYFDKVGDYIQNNTEGLQLTYDLLLVYTSKIEMIYKERNAIVRAMLDMLDKCYKHANIPESTKRDHPFRHALVMHQYLSISELIPLGRLAYQRIIEMFATPIAIPFSRKVKMIAGNFFSGSVNIKILSQIHPYVVQLALPLGDLKNERDTFINNILTEILTYPCVNGQIAIHSFQFPLPVHDDIQFDFKELLNFINIISHENLMLALGDTPDSYDVKAIRSKTKVLAQLRVILLDGAPSRIESAWGNCFLLKENLLAIFLPLSHFRPVYTWGSELDLALNDLLDELNRFSRAMIAVLHRPYYPPDNPVQSPSWEMMNFWEGGGRYLTSLVSLMNAMVNKLLPRITKLIVRMMPKHKVNDLLEQSKVPVHQILEHSYLLAKVMEEKGFYHSLTQNFIAPLRDVFMAIDLQALQQMLSIYHYEFEPVVDEFLRGPDEPLTVWKAYPKERKNELVLNAAKMLFCFRKLFGTLIPIIQPAIFDAMQVALGDNEQAKESLTTIRANVLDLQLLMVQEADPMLGKIIAFLEQSGESITIGGAANVALQSNVVGAVADVTMSSYQLSLGCVPSEVGLTDLPSDWNEKNLKQILSHEMRGCRRSLKQFTDVPVTLSPNQQFRIKKV